LAVGSLSQPRSGYTGIADVSLTTVSFGAHGTRPWLLASFSACSSSFTPGLSRAFSSFARHGVPRLGLTPSGSLNIQVFAATWADSLPSLRPWDYSLSWTLPPSFGVRTRNSGSNFINRRVKLKAIYSRSYEEHHCSHLFDALDTFAKLFELGVLVGGVRWVSGTQRSSPIDFLGVVIGNSQFFSAGVFQENGTKSASYARPEKGQCPSDHAHAST